VIEVQETVFNTISVRQSAHAERSGGRISCRVGEERERAREAREVESWLRAMNGVGNDRRRSSFFGTTRGRGDGRARPSVVERGRDGAFRE